MRFVLFTICAASLAWADPPPTLVAPRAVLVDPNDNDKVLMSKLLDSKNLQGSIAKLMTIYTASWAVRKGHAHWDDKVALTKRDTVQGCTCMKFKSQPNSPPATGCTSTSSTQVGETFELERLVQVSMNQSTGESTDAVAEHIARKVYNLPAATTQAESNHLMNLFIGLMNARAKDLKLTNSKWITVHGGDVCDFAGGCDPNCKPSSCDPSVCAQGAQCGGGTTVHDLALLWHALMRDEPNFLPLLGVRAFQLKQTNGTFYNSYGHWYGYYPGLDGDKNGGSGACPNTNGIASCWMAQATRAGHPLIGAVLQSFTNAAGGAINGNGFPDLTAMFRWGFAEVLRPNKKLSATFATGGAKDHAVACNLGQCFVALRTASDELSLDAWNADPSKGILAKLVHSTKSYPQVTALDVDASQLGTIVAVISGGQLVVGRWWMTGGLTQPGLPPNGKLTFIGDSGNKGGAGDLVRARLASDALAVTAKRMSDGTIHLSSWRMGATAPTAAVWLADGSSPNAPNVAGGELKLATFPDATAAGDFVAVTGSVTSAGAASLQAWRVSGTSGAITYLSSVSLGNARNLSIAGNGTGKLGSTFTVGTAATGKPNVNTWDVAHDGTFVPTMGSVPAMAGWTESTDASATAIVPLGPAAKKSGIVASSTFSTTTNTFTSATCGSTFQPSSQPSQRSSVGFLSAAQRATGSQLAAWDSPIHYQEQNSAMTDFRLSDSGSAWGTTQNLRVAAIPTQDALFNQYLTEELRSDGTLVLIGWQVGTPTPLNLALSP